MENHPQDCVSSGSTASMFLHQSDYDGSENFSGADIRGKTSFSTTNAPFLPPASPIPTTNTWSFRPWVVIITSALVVILFFISVIFSILSIQANTGPKGTTGPTGPPGPEGVLNISSVGQTFKAGNLEISNNITLDGSLNFDAFASIHANESCLFIEANRTCITNLNITGTQLGGDFEFDGCITVNKLQIGNVTFTAPFPGDTLHVGGGQVFFEFPIDPPIQIGSAGEIDDAGSGVLCIDAVSQIKLDGDTLFTGDIVGPVTVQDNALFLSGIQFDTETPTPTRLAIILGMFELFSEFPVNVKSDVSIWLDAPVTTVHENLTIQGNVSVEGYVNGPLKLTQSLEFVSGPGGSISMVGGCLTIAADNICIDGTTTFDGTGPVTFDGVDVEFINGAEIKTDLIIDGDLTVNDDVLVSGSLTILDTLIMDRIKVLQNSTFVGPIDGQDLNNFMAGLKTNNLEVNTFFRSFTLALFEGSGAAVGTGATFQVDGKLNLFQTPVNTKCSSIVFESDSIQNPNSFPCVKECPHFDRCDLTTKNLDIEETLLVKENMTVFGDILTSGGNLHPCCGGGAPIPDTLLISLSFAVFLTPSGIPIPYDTIHSGPNPLNVSYSNTTGFIIPATGIYTFTASVSWNTTEFGLGTYRAVGLRRAFTIPLVTTQTLTICQSLLPIASVSMTCTYTAFFSTGEDVLIMALHDHGGSLGIFGDGSGPTFSTKTRLEIIQH